MTIQPDVVQVFLFSGYLLTSLLLVSYIIFRKTEGPSDGQS